MRFEHDGDDEVRLVDVSGSDTAGVLATYVLHPKDASLESPRPYAMLRTRSGVDVTAYRPSDHVWHKGLSLALPVVGRHNFWGGPTYVHPDGYVQLPNNGEQRHTGLEISGHADVAHMTQTLDFVTEQGETILTERRTLTARGVDADAWALTWQSVLTNVSDAPLGFGSPTSKGRENAGYAGIFWRGPQSFTGGVITGEAGPVGDAARGGTAPWLSFASPDRSAGVLMLNPAPTDEPWFARSEEYAGLNPAPFFTTEAVVAPQASITLAAALIIGGPDVHEHAAGAGATLVAELRSRNTASDESTAGESHV